MKKSLFKENEVDNLNKPGGIEIDIKLVKQ